MTTFKDIIKKSVLESFDGGGITFRIIIISLAFAVLLAAYLFCVYRLINRNSFYQMNFNLSLVGMTIATAAIILSIQSNLVLSLGMVGALSIVRYRSAVKDPLDLFFLFWAVAIGIMCGAREYLLAIMVSVVMTLVLFVFSHIPVVQAPCVLVVNGREEDLGNIRDCISAYSKYFQVKSSYLNQGKLRMIVEIRTKNQDRLLTEIGKMDGVSVSILTYEGDVVG